jgi:hypothetical protein
MDQQQSVFLGEKNATLCQVKEEDDFRTSEIDFVNLTPIQTNLLLRIRRL